MNKILGIGGRDMPLNETKTVDRMTVTFSEIKTINRIFQGEIWIADLGTKEGNIQGGKRPVIVLQNDVGNKYSPTTIVLPLTTQLKNSLPVHANLGTKYGLKKVSTSLAEQITTINQSQLLIKIGKLDENGLETIKNSIVESLKGIL